MLSAGMFTERAFSIARRRRKLPSGSPPPARAAIVISRATFVKTAPRFWSFAPFWRLICDHFECPDIAREYTGLSWPDRTPRRPSEVVPRTGQRFRQNARHDNELR